MRHLWASCVPKKFIHGLLSGPHDWRLTTDSIALKRQGVLLLPPPPPPDGMLVHCSILSGIFLTVADTHLYTWID